jgi:hypothetical protein
MAPSIATAAVSRHPVLPDMSRPQMAKANVRNPDIDWNARVGAAVTAAIKACGWSSKEAAAKVSQACGSNVDDAEFGKWLSGARRPQFDKLFAVEALRQPLVIAMASLAHDVEIVTEIRIRKAVNS